MAIDNTCICCGKIIPEGRLCCHECETMDILGKQKGKCKLKNPVGNVVNHPSYYNDGKIEVIDYIEDQKLDFCLGNAVKYISRAGKKNKDKEIEDLEKAIWYIQRRIKGLKK